MSKDAYYFSHDSNARHDPKILALRSEHGIAGYGIYWVIIEMLREQDDFKLPKKNYVFNAIAMQVQSKDFAKEHAKVFVENCINEFDLFEENNDFFWSNSLLKRMEKKNDLSEKRRSAAKARWNKSDEINVLEESGKQNHANAMQNHANAEQINAIKGKEIKEKKVNKIKGNNINNDDSIESSFNEFWKVYPKKADKQAGLKAFKKAVKNHDPQIVINGAINYAKECQIKRTEKSYIKNPATFLNAESFLNDFETTGRGGNGGENSHAAEFSERFGF